MFDELRCPTARSSGITASRATDAAPGVYLSGGFGLWELTYPVIGAAIAFPGLGSYRLIGVGWLIHAGWDIAHHLWGNPFGRSCRVPRSAA